MPLVSDQNLSPLGMSSIALPLPRTVTKRRIVTVKVVSVAVVTGVLLFSQHRYTEDGLFDLMMEAAGFLMLLIGGFGRAWTSAFISGRKNRQLVTDGPYSMVRNPLYFFSFVSFAGAGLAFQSLAASAFLMLLFFATHWPAILEEERHLRSLFGESFDRYASSTPRFLPKPSLLTSPDVMYFTPSIFTRAVVDCSLIVSIFMLAHIIEWSHIHGRLPVLFSIP
ncbi:MAG: isoprenylcysteine carboxylmethyltransferase family protein [Planctomycetaceae bacterium]